MADFVTSMVRLLVRAVVLAMGLVFAACLLVVVFALAVLWGLRALWAKLTGQPLTPWVMRVNPRTGWTRASQTASRWQSAAKQPRGRAEGTGRDLTDLTDVTDVQVKEL
nr:hypothetical protein [uncultured Albidiferax sp.]